MFPPQFDYLRATSLGETFDLLDRHADDDPRLLAGGHSLIPDLKRRRADPGVVIDVSDVDALAGVDVDDDAVRVGAAVTYADLLADDRVRDRCRMLAEATHNVGDVQIRNRGTVGGNLAYAHPAADLPAAALVAGATFVLRDRDGEREVPAADFFLGNRQTAIGEGEVLTTVAFRTDQGFDDDSDAVGGAYAKKTHPASGYAMVGVAARVAVTDGAVAAARVATNGVIDHAVRLERVEDALTGSPASEEAVADATDGAGRELDPDALRSDVEATGEFRRRLLSAYAERALNRAIDRASGGAESGGGDGE